MSEQNEYMANSAAVQAHLSIVQSVIQRMASNSASSKAWCITLVSAILVIVADKSKPDYTWIALIPTFLFLILDAYYLALEKSFRDSYNLFIDKLHSGKIEAPDLYVVSPEGKIFVQFRKSLISFSVWPFYLTLVVMVWLTRTLVL